MNGTTSSSSKSACRAIAAFCTLSFTLAVSSMGQVPEAFTIQGVLTQPDGTPIDETVSIASKIYDGSNLVVWENLGASVAVTDGRYELTIEGYDLNNLSFDEPLWLGLFVEGEALLPRIPLRSAPYALGVRGFQITNRPNAEINIVGGYQGNQAVGDVVGVVIAGGGKGTATAAPNEVHSDYSVVSGGYGNLAGTGQNSNGRNATVSGGRTNEAYGIASTVGGGQGNEAHWDHSTVGGGENNTAFGGHAVVSGGQDNYVTNSWGTVSGGRWGLTEGYYATVGGGRQNHSTAESATVPGGSGNTAAGRFAFAAGRQAKANHIGAFVWADSDGDVSSADDFASTGVDQFLVRAAGGVGINTNNPEGQSLNVNGGIRARSGTPGAYGVNNNGYTFSGTGGDSDGGMFSTGDHLVQFYTDNHERMRIDGYFVGIGTTVPKDMLHVVDPYGGSLIWTGEAAKGGPNGIVFEDDTESAGVQLVWRTSPNQLLLEKGSTGGSSTPSAAAFYDRGGDYFYFNSANTQIDTSPDASRHVVHIRNTNTGARGDVLALSLAATSPNADNNFVTFFKGPTNAIGAVEVNGAGTGITFSSTSADYAEMLPRLDLSESMAAGDIVGVFGGRVSKRTDGADRLLVVTERPSVLGNVPDPDRQAEFEQVAFLGQVPVLVRGRAESGDYIVPSGDQDGSGLALAPDAITLKDARRIVGRVWGTGESAAPRGYVIAEVGLDKADLFARLLERQQEMIALQQAQIDYLRQLLEGRSGALGTSSASR